MIPVGYFLAVAIAVTLLGLTVDLIWCHVRDCRNRALQNRRIRLARNARACQRTVR